MAGESCILVVEDDPRTAALLDLYLREAGFSVDVVHDGEAGLAHARGKPPDLVVLDLMLPGRDGWSVCKELRDGSDVPILILSARQEEDDRLTGLGLGADDYVVKPFSPREIVLRVRAILRRVRPASPDASGLRIDRARCCAVTATGEIALTPSEYRILDALMAARGRTLQRSELLDYLYPTGGCVVPKVVDVHVAKLRNKIGDDPLRPRFILTVRGFGYRFAGDV